MFTMISISWNVKLVIFIMKKLVPEFRYTKKEVQFQKYGCYPKEIEPNIHVFSLGLTTTLTLFFRTILEDIGMKFPIYIQKQNLLNRWYYQVRETLSEAIFPSSSPHGIYLGYTEVVYSGVGSPFIFHGYFGWIYVRISYYVIVWSTT